MRPEGRDRACLWDMLAAAREAQEHVQGLTFEQYIIDLKARRAIERTLEIIGEAASKVSEAFYIAHPEIDWRRIKGLRNIISHEYDKVRHDLLWAVVKTDLPVLIARLETIHLDPNDNP